MKNINLDKDNERIDKILNYYTEIAYLDSYVEDVSNMKGEIKENNVWKMEGIHQNYFSKFPFLSWMNNNNINYITRNFLLENNNLESDTENKITFTNDDIKELNESQKEAVKRAFKERVSIIKGPPGTGKTHTIIKIIEIIKENTKNGKPISLAFVSNNKEAINNVTGKLKEKEDIKLAKLGNKNNRKEFNKNQKSNLYFQIENEDKYPNDGKIPLVTFKLNDEAYNIINHHNHIMDDDINIRNGDRVSFSGWTYALVDKENKETKLSFNDFFKENYIISSTIHSLMKNFPPNITSENTKAPPQFDYVIIDEASQCDVILGLCAMNSAKNLIIVGDTDQLAPIANIYDSPKNTIEDIKHSEYYKTNESNTDGMSILKACENILIKADKSNFTILTEHYRCHPGIIEFCKKNVYNNELIIKTDTTNFYTKKINIPIKILYYDGSYCEATNTNGRISRKNMRQVKIFVNTELEYIIKRLEDNENTTVAILSPFKGQLDSLYEEINRYIENKKHNINKEYLELINFDDNENGILTIHKSQGKEYDLVYILPAEDLSYEWPFSQSKRLINVALSRAKQEVRIICSTCLMSEKIQKQIHNDKNFKYVEHYKSSKKDDEGEEEYKARVELENNNQLFIKKLINYVNKNITEYDKKNGYGLVKANYERSVFDKLPQIRQKYKYNEENNSDLNNIFSTEECMKDCLNQICDEMKEKLNINQNFLIKNLDNLPKNLSDEKKEYIKNCAHIDFLITKENGDVILCVEVDGEYHRFNKDLKILKEQKKRDKMKDKIIGKNLILRIKTNGENGNEEKHIKKAIKENLKRSVLPSIKPKEEWEDKEYDRLFEVSECYYMGIERWIKRLKNKENIREEAMTINNILIDNGLLKSAPKHTPTEKLGKENGIIEYINKNKDYIIAEYNCISIYKICKYLKSKSPDQFNKFAYNIGLNIKA